MMPMLEGSASSIVTSPMAILGPDERKIIEERIPLFELHRVKRGFVDVNDMGYINVRVSDGINLVTHRGRRSVRWFTDKNANITYKHQGDGLLVAYCPDDEAWFNRIKLASTIKSGLFRIVRYHTVSGVVSEDRITDEIKFISYLIHDWKAVASDGTEFRSRDVEAVKKFIYDKHAAGVEVQGPLFSKRKTIQDLIKRYRSRWVYSDEFQNGIKKKIQDEIAKRFKPQQAYPEMQDAIRDYFSSMTPDQRRAFFEGGPDAVDRSSGGSIEGKTIEEMNVEEIREIAATYSVSTVGRSKDDIIKEIIMKSKGENATADDVLGPSNTNGASSKISEPLEEEEL